MKALRAPSAPPRVAVALGGGGARGYAHIGVLQVLAERGHDVVTVAGCSMGAVIGGLYAAGGLEPFTDWVRGLTHRDVLRMYDLAPTAPGAIRAEKIFARVSDILGDARIEDLPVPFTAVATDLTAGEERWFQEGPVDVAIRASAALPGFITPVVLHGRLLADGGLVNPLPITPTVAAGADLTIAVAVSDHFGAAAPPAASAPSAARGRRDALRRTATHVLDTDVLHGLGTRLAARRGDPRGGSGQPAGRAAREEPFEALPAGLRTLDVVEMSLGALRTAVLRHTLAEHPPDVLITIPRSACRMLDFHKAEDMIGLGRALAEEALDRDADARAAGQGA